MKADRPCVQARVRFLAGSVMLGLLGVARRLFRRVENSCVFSKQAFGVIDTCWLFDYLVDGEMPFCHVVVSSLARWTLANVYFSLLYISQETSF